MAITLSGSDRLDSAEDNYAIGDITIAARIKFSSKPSSGFSYGVVGKLMNSAPYSGVAISISDAGKSRALSRANNTNNIATGGDDLSTNSWVHVAITRQGTTMKAWAGGVAVDTVTDANIEQITHNQGWAIGAFRTGDTAERFVGSIADACVFEEVLTGTQISLLASGRRPNAIGATDLIHWWPLVDNYNDSVGGLTLTPNGSPSFTDHPSYTGDGGPASTYYRQLRNFRRRGPAGWFGC